MKSLQLVAGLALIVVAVYVGFELIPPYFSNYRFQDAIENEALFDSYSSKSEADVRKVVLKKAQELEIPITEEQIKVQRIGNNGLVIAVDYTVHVDLPSYPLDIAFHPGSKNRPPF